ncbi:MAG: hypothetical protein JWP66_1698 [Naasia sp.]|nr:hypothetical protein [Naasia sp.]
MADKTPQLLDYLSRADGWVGASELAERLGVSTRTVRSYVTAIKSAAAPLEVVASSTSGYRLNRDAYARHLSDSAHRSGSPEKPRERVAFLVSTLTESAAEHEVHALADRLFVSLSTLESDLRRVRSLAREAGADLLRSGDRVRITGDEGALRRLISRIFREESARGMFDLRQVEEAFAVGDLSAFKTDVIALLEESGYAVNDFGLDGVLVHTAIAVERTRRRGAEPTADAAHAPPARATAELEGALAPLVARHFGAALPDGELASLALLLVTRVGTRQRAEEAAAADRATVARILGEAQREYLVDLDDEEFLLRLTLHVRNLVTRARAGIATRNPLARSIKTSYPLTYELAVYLASGVQQEYAIAISDDEIAFLALHVGSHLERHARPEDEVTAALVLPGYHDLADVVRGRIEAAVGSELRIVQVLPRSDAPIDGLGTDLVITTLPRLGAPDAVVVVSPFPTATELDAVRAAVARVRRHRRRGRIKDELLRYLDERLYVRDIAADDEAGVIRVLGQRMIALGHIDEAYLEGALERERLSSTAFTETLAVPHSMAMTAERTAIALAVNKSPIPWGDGRVNVVAFVAFSAEGRAAFQTVFEQFVDVFADRADVQRLLHGPADFGAFVERLVAVIDS